ncbi:ABC transporter substrate-binding protein [Chitinimonas koreensis]|uniref:ABC transporter substrate-binding protein n=1 Tax=Chitinimonas koreensis TaxID=356302 RepID=UPI0004111804|nr:ABC transporter substrate-binding protein [Chitinimonas koreensis]QNM98766.1 ABC transporter substrate-binding protein [Chitinimonas koreensis]
MSRQPQRRRGAPPVLQLVVLLLCSWMPAAAAERPPRLVFINPGLHDESFWVTYAGLMEGAAHQLGWRLETRYAERDHLKMVALAQEALAAERKPDYLLIVNEKPVMVPVLLAAERAGVDVLLLSVGLNPQEQAIAGQPRTRFRHWIGTILPDNRQAGYLVARAVLAERPTAAAPARLAVLRGVRATRADADRHLGLRRYLAEQGRAGIAYSFDANWRRDDARRQLGRLLGFDAAIDAVWAANDQMALGAADALSGRVADGPAGRPSDVPVSGVLSSREGVEALAAGRLHTMPGGHLALGACAVLMLDDYRKGRDFARGGERGGQAEVTVPIFEPVDRAGAASWLRLFDPAQWSRLPYARWRPARAGDYRCQASTLLVG